MNYLVKYARDALNYFQVKEDGHGRKKYCLSSECPSWVHRMCWAAHFELLPNDVVYEFVYDILAMVSESSDEQDPEELQQSVIDSLEDLVAVNHEAIRWFAECYPLSAVHVNQYKKEAGMLSDVMDEIRGGAVIHLTEIAECIFDHLRMRAGQKG